MAQEGSQDHPGNVFECRRVESMGQQYENRPQHDRDRRAVQKRPFLQVRRVLEKKKKGGEMSGGQRGGR